MWEQRQGLSWTQGLETLSAVRGSIYKGKQRRLEALIQMEV